MTKDDLTMLRELAGKATFANWSAYRRGDGYHPNDASVRGPFGRWFMVQGGDEHPDYVADKDDDAKFAAAAMNNLVPLLNKIDELERELEFEKENRKNLSSVVDDLYSAIERGRE